MFLERKEKVLREKKSFSAAQSDMQQYTVGSCLDQEIEKEANFLYNNLFRKKKFVNKKGAMLGI